ncbi:MAG: hypothetical protein QM611_05320 [Microbacterium sp.]|uniref:hypothetical protein n=1 Tax=Microbacterium sp. TaxID=51671 RepID=UPI0039E4C9BE
MSAAARSTAHSQRRPLGARLLTVVFTVIVLALIALSYGALAKHQVEDERSRLASPADVDATPVLDAVKKWQPSPDAVLSGPKVATQPLMACQPAQTFTWSIAGVPRTQIAIAACVDQFSSNGVSALASATQSKPLNSDHIMHIRTNLDKPVQVRTTGTQGIVFRTWSAGQFAYVMRTQCAGDVKACDAENAERTQSLADALPPVDIDRQTARDSGTLGVLIFSLVATVIVLAALIVPRILVKRSLARPIRGLPADAIDADTSAEFTNFARISRGTGMFMTILCSVRIIADIALINAMGITGFADDLRDPILWGALILGIPMWALGAKRLRRLDIHRTQLVGGSTASAVGRALVTATRVGLGFVALLLIATLTGGYVGVATPNLNIQVHAIDLATQPPYRFFPQTVLFLFIVVAAHGLVWALLLLVALGIALIALTGLGHRLAVASIHEEQQSDPRPPILLLRSFDEDHSKVATRVLRPSLLPLGFTPVRRMPLEQVLAHGLRAFGPVVAITPPGTRLPQLGAAKSTFTDDEWRPAIEQLAAESLAVVVQATPPSITKDGFGWELDLLDKVIQHDRLILVLGPYPEQERDERWARFVEYASKNPAMTELATIHPPKGLRIAARSTEHGWKLYGGEKADDATYLAALRMAAVELDEDWRSEVALDAELRDLLSGGAQPASGGGA